MENTALLQLLRNSQHHYRCFCALHNGRTDTDRQVFVVMSEAFIMMHNHQYFVPFRITPCMKAKQAHKFDCQLPVHDLFTHRIFRICHTSGRFLQQIPSLRLFIMHFEILNPLPIERRVQQLFENSVFFVHS
jgi:hypothetical protein